MDAAIPDTNLMSQNKHMRHLPDPTEQPTITVEHAAVVLGIGRTAAYKAARTGELPTIKFGRRTLVPVAALRRMVGLDQLGTHNSGELAS